MPNTKNQQVHTSPAGDLLLHDVPISAALFVAQRDFGAFCTCPQDAPHYPIRRPIELETLRLVHEFGFSFSTTTMHLLVDHPGLAGRPLLHFELPDGITLGLP